MKTLYKLLLLLILPSFLSAQEQLPDNISNAFQKATNDSMKFAASQDAAYYFVELNRDSLLYYVNQCIFLAQKNSQELEEAWGLASRGYCLTGIGEYSQALQNFYKAFAITENPKYDEQEWLPPGQTGRQRRLYYLSYTHHLYAVLMRRVRNYEQAITHFLKAKTIAGELNIIRGVLWADYNLGFTYHSLNKPDSALHYLKLTKDIATKTPGEKKYLGEINYNIGDIMLERGDTVTAKQLYYEAIQSAEEQKNYMSLIRAYGNLSNLYFQQKLPDSSLWYAKKAFENSQLIGSYTTNVIRIGGVYKNLYQSFLLNNQKDSAIKYADLALTANDSISNNEILSLADFQKLTLEEQLRLQNLEKEKVVYQNRMKLYASLAGIIVILLIAAILFRNNRKKQKANKALEQALTTLKATQTQLIQSEKMASLGELTAGIAHEIQNPLNFVNNFSDVNIELLDEMQDEMKQGNSTEALAIASDVKQNLSKISHHGKRADAIVKSMLQHSRKTTGIKEPADLNALVDEYLRLSYHGLRAKDKNFNVHLQTHYDPSVGRINMVSQDIGRVLLNLFNNAFYAVSKKKAESGKEFEPAVSVRTVKKNNIVEVHIKDNGTGIPENVLDKIYQPFFTTKPTGEGTGLGLSLSYDIITKGHGGEMKVNTKEGEGAEFIIQLQAE